MEYIDDLIGKHYFTCSACMSVWADALSWANTNPKRVVKDPDKADNIIVLSCQVTDLAILSDFRVAERLVEEFPGKNIFISGCLAQRDDIELPKGVRRLHQMRSNYQHLLDRSLMHYEKPFWVKDFVSKGTELEDGHLFRDKYPLRIGKGCPFHCTYCTINKTRGKHEKYDIEMLLTREFMSFDNVVLIADSPTPDQIQWWCDLAIDKRKKISIRNIEPQVAIQCMDSLMRAASEGVLDVFHCPIQSNNPEVLKDMHRNVEATMGVISFVKALKLKGVKIATNIIVDYKEFPNNFDDIYELYDYVSWNPLWDGKWDRKRAEERYDKYFNNRI